MSVKVLLSHTITKFVSSQIENLSHALMYSNGMLTICFRHVDRGTWDGGESFVKYYSILLNTKLPTILEVLDSSYLWGKSDT